jgi:hypothetical protein
MYNVDDNKETTDKANHFEQVSKELAKKLKTEEDDNKALDQKYKKLNGIMIFIMHNVDDNKETTDKANNFEQVSKELTKKLKTEEDDNKALSQKHKKLNGR